MTLDRAKLTPFMTERLYLEEMYQFYLDWFEVESDRDEDIISFGEFLYFQDHMSKLCPTHYPIYNIDFVVVAEDENGELIDCDFLDLIVIDELIANGNIQKLDIE